MGVSPLFPDIAVIGAGPVSCVTALAFARRGARVLLLEAHVSPSRRLAGEWLHPLGVQALHQIGIDTTALSRSTGRGFVIYPGDYAKPFFLSYPNGRSALICEHHALVETLRTAVSAQPGICFVPGAKVTTIDGQKVHYSVPCRPETTVAPSLIVGADGRVSLARRILGLEGAPVSLSSMAGLILEDVELPCPGFGHLLFGGPGVVILYAIGPGHLRLLLDVPGMRGKSRDAAFLWQNFNPLLPMPLRAAFRRSLEAGPISWAANSIRSRIHYGRSGLALVGDAVGHFHPLTAMGMTLGFLDAVCLASSRSVQDYKRQRMAQNRMAEMLASLGYWLATSQEAATATLRHALCEIGQRDSSARRQAISFLCGEATNPLQFSCAFTKVVGVSLKHVWRTAVRSWDWRPAAQMFTGLCRWFAWLAMEAAGQWRSGYSLART